MGIPINIAVIIRCRKPDALLSLLIKHVKLKELI